MVLGAGRETKADVIDLQVGVIVEEKVGAKVTVDTPLFTVYGNDETKVNQAKSILENVVFLSETKRNIPLIHQTITSS